MQCQEFHTMRTSIKNDVAAWPLNAPAPRQNAGVTYNTYVTAPPVSTHVAIVHSTAECTELGGQREGGGMSPAILPWDVCLARQRLSASACVAESCAATALRVCWRAEA